MLNNVSVLMITKNEEEKIQGCLKSIEWAGEIIVIDAESRDRTRAIAKEWTDKVYIRKFDNYKNQKNFGLQYCTREWVLAIDADERISPQLRKEIEEELKNAQYNFYAFPFLTYFLGKPLHYGLVYPAYHVRLFRRVARGEKCRWRRAVHEQLICGKKEIGADNREVGKFQNNVLHYSFDTIEHYFKKFNYYTSLDAQEILKTQQDRFNHQVSFNPHSFFSSLWFFLYRPCRLFIRRFVRYQGFRDGVYGFVYTLFSSWYEVVVRVKYWSRIVK